MLRIVLAAVALALAAIPALADDKLAPQVLTVKQVVEIHAALSKMPCVDRVIKDGAKETLVCDPLPPEKLKVGLAWQIAKNLRKTTDVVGSYQRERQRLLSTYPRKPDGNLTDEAAGKFIEQDYDLLNQGSGIQLDHFKQSEIESLNEPPGVIAALLPIIDP